MTAGPSPAVMGPGVIVRIRLGALVYPSKRLTLEDARAVRARVLDRLSRASGMVDLGTDFPPADLELLAVRADKVVAVELRCVNGDGALLPAGALLAEDSHP